MLVIDVVYNALGHPQAPQRYSHRRGIIKKGYVLVCCACLLASNVLLKKDTCWATAQTDWQSAHLGEKSAWQ